MNITEIDIDDLKDSVNDGLEDPSVIQDEGIYTKGSFDESLRLEELTTKREYNRLLRQNREEKKKYAKWIFSITSIWSIAIFLIVIGNGLKCITRFDFVLSDKVIITLITSTTINFFGFFFLVVKYLFNTDDIINTRAK